MKTEGLYSATYGRFEWRASLPSGLGFWPALWMLGNNITSINWPDCGEIDVVENKGTNLFNVQRRQPPFRPAMKPRFLYIARQQCDQLPRAIFSEWTTNAINWYVDGVQYETVTNWTDSGRKLSVPFQPTVFHHHET